MHCYANERPESTSIVWVWMRNPNTWCRHPGTQHMSPSHMCRTAMVNVGGEGWRLKVKVEGDHATCESDCGFVDANCLLSRLLPSMIVFGY